MIYDDYDLPYNIEIDGKRYAIRDNREHRLILKCIKILNDGDVIVVYSNEEIKKAQKEERIVVETPCVCEEVKNDSCYKEDKETETTSKININTATINELIKLNGIGESKAKLIIEYRTKNGKFKDIKEIMNIKGISETLFSKIKENITI